MAYTYTNPFLRIMSYVIIHHLCSPPANEEFDPENRQFSAETLQKLRAKDGEIIVFG